jgi:hypothetical protein
MLFLTINLTVAANLFYGYGKKNTPPIHREGSSVFKGLYIKTTEQL